MMVISRTQSNDVLTVAVAYHHCLPTTYGVNVNDIAGVLARFHSSTSSRIHVVQLRSLTLYLDSYLISQFSGVYCIASAGRSAEESDWVVG